MSVWKFASVILLGFAAAAMAQDPGDLAKKIINDPSDPHVDGAKASLRDDPGVQGGKVLRIVIAKKGSPRQMFTTITAAMA